MENSANTVDAPEKPPKAHPPLPTTSEKKDVSAHAPAVKAPEKEDKLHWANRMLKVVTFPIGFLSGFWVVHTDVRASLYKTVRANKEFQAIEKEFQAKHQVNVTKCDKGLIDQHEFRAGAFEIQKANRKAVQHQMDKLGIGSFTKKWKHLTRSNQQKAIIEGMTVAGIAIGALLTIANSKTLIEMFSGKEEDTQPDKTLATQSLGFEDREKNKQPDKMLAI